MHIDIPTLETARLSLVAPDRTHLDAWVALYGSAHVMAHIGEPLDRPKVWQMLAGRIGHWHLRGFGTWSIRHRASGTLCGVVGLKRPEGEPDIEMGWMLLPQYWGSGLAREAAQAALDFGFEQVGATRLVARVAPGNAGSIQVAEKIGLRRVASPADAELLVFIGRRASESAATAL